MRWDPTDLAWMAGLLEGEGAFILSTKHSPTGIPYPAFVIAVNLTDEDVLARLARLAGMGKFSGPHQPQQPHHKPHWRWAVYRRDDVAALCTAILPLMGRRRGARIREILAAYDATGRSWSHGTVNGYDGRGCRCASCRAANAAKGRRQRARRAAQRPAS